MTMPTYMTCICYHADMYIGLALRHMRVSIEIPILVEVLKGECKGIVSQDQHIW
jgi:hypothetical protein